MDFDPEIRKKVVIREAFPGVGGREVVRVVGVLVIKNPCLEGENLLGLHPLGESLGTPFIGELVALLPTSVCSYGKATLVGQLGTPEHGAVLMHPSLGKPIRAAIGGGEAIIPSNVKVGTLGSTIDVPLSHKDDPWSFDHLDTIPVSVADAPQPDEILLIIALSNGARPTL